MASKKARMTSKNTFISLSHDMQAKITCKFPPADIGRWRTVSRSFADCLSSEDFVERYVHRYKSDPFFAVRGDKRSFYNIRLTNDELTVVRGSKSWVPFFNLGARAKWFGSGDLVVVVDDDNSVYLWNPTTMRHRNIPVCSWALEPQTSASVYGSGRCLRSSDVKILCLSWERILKSPPTQIDVYSLRDDSWRTFPSKPYSDVSAIVALRGFLYFSARKAGTTVVVRFSTDEEAFDEITFPCGPSPRHNLVTFADRLHLVSFNPKNLIAKVEFWTWTWAEGTGGRSGSFSWIESSGPIRITTPPIVLGFEFKDRILYQGLRSLRILWVHGKRVALLGGDREDTACYSESLQII